MFALRWVVALGLCAASSNSGHAQPAPMDGRHGERVYVIGDAVRNNALVAKWTNRIRTDAHTIGFDLLEQEEQAPLDKGLTWTSHSNADALNQVESLLLEARSEAAALQEGRALTTLTRASKLAESLTHVPGAAAWIAEVYISLGLIVGQSGQTELMESFLARAANFDPSRMIQAAEAAPNIVERAAQIAHENAQKPAGTFWVRSIPRDAFVTFDNTDMGRTPIRIRATMGRHLLRLHAQNFSPYGTMIDVLEGERPDIEIHLSPERVFELEETLRIAAGSNDFERIVAELKQRQVQSAVWLIEPRNERTLVTRCTENGCSATIRLEHSHVPHDLSTLLATPNMPGSTIRIRRTQDREWLRERASLEKPPSTPWWKRWYLWTSIGIAVAAATGTAIYALRPKADQRLITTIDFGDLRP